MVVRLSQPVSLNESASGCLDNQANGILIGLERSKKMLPNSVVAVHAENSFSEQPTVTPQFIKINPVYICISILR